MQSPPPSIVMQLHGGLGNQMFQAAAGLALSRRTGLPLAFDLSRFRRGSHKAYALADFKLPALLLQPMPATIVNRAKRLVARALGHRAKGPPIGWYGTIYNEPHFHYDPKFAALKGPVFSTGYFQSPKYFAGCEDAVRDAFDAKHAVSEKARHTAQDICKNATLAVHIRRGDMASDPKMAAVHGTLGFDYYDAAVAHVRNMVPDVRALFFSDDQESAKAFAERYKGEAVRGQSALDDLWLMSQCNHHIIANSSFSWWSAYLDPHPDGMRVAPKQWFTMQELEQVDTNDLIPSRWYQF